MEEMKIFVVLFTLLAFTGFLPIAEAKKFGGGGSFGHSKKVAPKNHAPKQTPAKPANETKAGQIAGAGAAGMAAKSGASKWLGPLAGLAAGGLIAAMIFGDGFEGFQVFDFLLIGLVAFMLFALFRRRRSQADSQAKYNQAEQTYQPEASTSQQQYRESQNYSSEFEPYKPRSGASMIGSGLSESSHTVAEKPDWFNEVEFINGAKGHYIAVQKAWDDLNVTEIKSYCSPELFEGIQEQMQQMQAGSNYTEVEDLYAEIADMAIDGDYFIVSVRFSGFIKEGVDEMSHAFNEIWHIRREASNQGDWEISGIQQTDNG